jgi:hypothetical protein
MLNPSNRTPIAIVAGATIIGLIVGASILFSGKSTGACGKPANTDAERAAMITQDTVTNCLKNGMTVEEAERAMGFKADVVSSSGEFQFVSWLGLGDSRIICTFNSDGKLIGKLGRRL